MVTQRDYGIAGIGTPVEFSRASAVALVAAFHSKMGWSWWQAAPRIRGWGDV